MNWLKYQLDLSIQYRCSISSSIATSSNRCLASHLSLDFKSFRSVPIKSKHQSKVLLIIIFFSSTKTKRNKTRHRKVIIVALSRTVWQSMFAAARERTVDTSTHTNAWIVSRRCLSNIIARWFSRLHQSNTSRCIFWKFYFKINNSLTTQI